MLFGFLQNIDYNCFLSFLKLGLQGNQTFATTRRLSLQDFFGEKLLLPISKHLKCWLSSVCTMYGGRHAFLRAAEVYVPFVLLYFRFCTFNVKTFCVPFLKDALEKATSWTRKGGHLVLYSLEILVGSITRKCLKRNFLDHEFWKAFEYERFPSSLA